MAGAAGGAGSALTQSESASAYAARVVPQTQENAMKLFVPLLAGSLMLALSACNDPNAEQAKRDAEAAADHAADAARNAGESAADAARAAGMTERTAYRTKKRIRERGDKQGELF